MIKFQPFHKVIASDDDWEFEAAKIAKVGNTYVVLRPAAEIEGNRVIELYAAYAEFSDYVSAREVCAELNKDL